LPHERVAGEIAASNILGEIELAKRPQLDLECGCFDPPYTFLIPAEDMRTGIEAGGQSTRGSPDRFEIAGENEIEVGAFATEQEIADIPTGEIALGCSETLPHATKEQIALESGNINLGHGGSRIVDQIRISTHPNRA
jgi:hypothetical protein